MKISNKGLDLIKDFEGLYLTAYVCPAGLNTIGWGTTRINGRPVRSGLKITKSQAEEYLLKDLEVFERGVMTLLGNIVINENQFSALVSFSYNVGLTALRNSTLLRVIKRNPNDAEIRNQFMRWTRASGIILNGLVRRRKSEADLYFSIV